MKCTVCEDFGWVCEDHRDMPWDRVHVVHPPRSDLVHPPRLPAGTHIEFDKKGWRH
jgi:hypothetical protein